MISLLSSARRSSFLLRLPRSFFSIKSGSDSYSCRGRLYEEKCQKILGEHLKTTVNLVGGAGDGGIDLTWSLPLKNNRFINFIGQCKAKESKKVESAVCRGLEGSLSACPPGTIGCLITNGRPSSDCLDRIKSSVYPIMYMQINEHLSCNKIYETFLNDRIKMLFPLFTATKIRTPTDSHVTFHCD